MSARYLQYHFADFVLDEREHRLKRAGEDIYLQPKVFQTLLCLVNDAGRLATKQELLACVWPEVSVTENVLTRCVGELRDALGDEPHRPRFIETVPRLGYRFIAVVEVLPSPAEDDRGTSGDVALHTRPDEAPAAPDVPVGGTSENGAVNRILSPPHALRRRRLIWLGAAILVVLAGAVSGMLAWRNRPALSFGVRDLVLVIDVENRTGEVGLGRTLAAAFVVSVAQSSHVSLLPRWRTRDVLQRLGKAPDRRIDEDVGREICLREHVRGLVAISVTRDGPRYAITAGLVDPVSGRAVRSRVEYANDRGRVLPALQSLASSVRRDLGEPLASIRAADRNLSEVTSGSLEALKYYVEGLTQWEKGEYFVAVELYEAAIREDPAFAMAQAALGSAYCSHIFGDQTRGRQHYERAIQLPGRTTVREGMSIRIAYETDLGHADAASALYKAYLESYPDDFGARYNFAAMLMRDSRAAEAAPHLAQVVSAASTYAPAHLNLATCYGLMGRYPEAKASYSRAFSLEPKWITSSSLNHEYGFFLIRAGEVRKAREVFQLALPTDSKPTALRSLGSLDMYEGRFADARARFEEAVQAAASAGSLLDEARGRLFLAMAIEGQGNRAVAIEELVRAAQVARADRRSANNWLRVRIAAAQARLGVTREADRLLEEFRRSADPHSGAERSDLLRLEGEVRLALGDPDRALASLRLADSEHHGPFTVESLARLARFQRDIEGEISQYRALLSLESDSLGSELQQDWLVAHYWLAQALVSRADPVGARAALAPLLAIWREADPKAPPVAEARLLAARLGVQ